MSTDAGAAGAFGLYLPNFEQVKDLYEELQAYVKAVREDDEGEDLDSDPDGYTRTPEFRDRFIRALAERCQIIVPASASLVWTGNNDDRPARCTTGAEEWVLGFGIFTKPWEYPLMDESFKRAAKLHDWVWIG